MRDHCDRCGQQFNPNDKAFDGAARYRDTKYCRYCIDRCHEATEFDHDCIVCRDSNWTDTRPGLSAGGGTR